MLKKVLREVGTYDYGNHLRTNLTKTRTCSFHPRNREAEPREKYSIPEIFTSHIGKIVDVSRSLWKFEEINKHTWEILRTIAVHGAFSRENTHHQYWKDRLTPKKSTLHLTKNADWWTGCFRNTNVEGVYWLVGIAPPIVTGSVQASRRENENTKRQ